MKTPSSFARVARGLRSGYGRAVAPTCSGYLTLAVMYPGV